MAKGHYENIPLKIKQEIGNYAAIYWTKAATDRFSKIYSNFSLKRTTVNAWKEELKKNFLHWLEKKENQISGMKKCCKRSEIYNGWRLAGTLISGKMVIATGAGVIKANEPKIAKEFGGSLELTEGGV